MEISQQCVVALTWTLKDTLGEELDVLDDPVEFLIGGNDLLPPIEEALQDLDRGQWRRLPLLLCVAEADRPGRMAGLDDQLLAHIQSELGVSFAPTSALVPHGRVGVAVALAQARALMA